MSFCEKKYLEVVYELTEEDFELYMNEFAFWVNMYSLGDWEFHYYFEPDEEENCETRASISYDPVARIALVFLNSKWMGLEPTEFEVRKCAYHEACELLLGHINDLARSRTVTEKQIESQMHSIIRSLENAHFYDYYKNRNLKK